MKASIIIPFYNQKPDLLLACLESAFNQKTKHNYEVILVNDGSTKNEGFQQIQETIDFFLKETGRNFTYQYQENKGTPGALNKGIKISRGEYIKWLSSDDVLYPNYLEKMFEHIDKLTDLERSETAIYFSDYRIIDERGAVIDTWKEPAWNEKTYWDRKKYLWMSFYGNGSSSLIPKAVFDKVGLFDETCRHSEDYEFWLRCCMVYDYDLYHIPECLIQYRSHPGQLSKQPGLFGSLDHEIRCSILQKMKPEQIYELYRRHDKENP